MTLTVALLVLGPSHSALAKDHRLRKRRAHAVRLIRESARTSRTRAARLVRRRGGRDVLELWFRESRWNHRARKGRRIGLAQMSSWKLVGVRPSYNPHVQAEAFYKYVDKRYGGDPGRALSHLKRRGWY